MDKEDYATLKDILNRVAELETIVRAHRQLISQHHSALQTVAKIMEEERNANLIP